MKYIKKILISIFYYLLTKVLTVIDNVLTKKMIEK